MRTLLNHFLFGAALVTASLNIQAQPLDQLASLLSGYDRFSANFDQYLTNEQGDRGESSTGYFAIQRPNRFAWITETPFPQEILSDGEYIWIYDPDLEQATRKPADENTDSAPALILNGRIHELNQRYHVELIQQTEDTLVFELLPKDSDDILFSRVRLLFNDAVLSELLLDDSLGQRSMIQLSDQQLNPELEDDIFNFDPPDNIDVIMDSRF